MVHTIAESFPLALAREVSNQSKPKKLADSIRALGPEYKTETWLLQQDLAQLRFYACTTTTNQSDYEYLPIFTTDMKTFVHCLLAITEEARFPKGMTVLFLFKFAQHMVQLG
jgi:hypothetical protein